MPRKKAEKKRGPGRPLKQPESAHELQAKARQGIRKTAERQLNREGIHIPELVEEVESITGKHKFTREEMDELRRKVDLIYTEFINEQWEAEAKSNEPYIEAMRAAALQKGEAVEGMMTPAQWHEAHGRRYDGTKKRGPAPKKKKTVFDLSPGERGTAEKPGEPIDVESMEQQLEAKLMEEYIKERDAQPQHIVGKRLRKDHLTPPKRANVKSFWI